VADPWTGRLVAQQRLPNQSNYVRHSGNLDATRHHVRRVPPELLTLLPQQHKPFHPRISQLCPVTGRHDRLLPKYVLHALFQVPKGIFSSGDESATETTTKTANTPRTINDDVVSNSRTNSAGGRTHGQRLVSICARTEAAPFAYTRNGVAELIVRLGCGVGWG
jgi:hypothetical protein